MKFGAVTVLGLKTGDILETAVVLKLGGRRLSFR